MNGEREFPMCDQERGNCYAIRNGRCRILTDTHFKNKVCPFFDTKDGFEKRDLDSRIHLMATGQEHLIQKFRKER